METTPQVQRTFGKKSTLPVIGLVLAVVLALAALGYFYWNNQTKPPGTTLGESPTPTQTAPSPTTEALVEGESQIQTYSSQALGVSFNHLPRQTVTEEGTKIYISETPDAKSGQFVEVFEKDPGVSLRQAIETRFLSGVDREICWVDTTQLENGRELAEIAHPKVPLDSPDWQRYQQTCGLAYTQTNGIRYFEADPQHPNKYLFVDLGQYMIPVGNTPWQDTLKILN